MAKKGYLASKICFHISLLSLGIISAGAPILKGNAALINSMLGIKTTFGTSSGGLYYETKYKNMAEVKEASLDIVEKVVAEGAVLLKNDNALPLSNGASISTFGFGSHFTVLTGQGSSGNSNKSGSVNVYSGLKNAGFSMNSDLDTFYATQETNAYTTKKSYNIVAGESQESEFVVSDIAWDSLPASKNNSVDAAVMVISRSSGEARDLYFDVTMEEGDQSHVTGGSTGDALSLSENEKDVLLHLKTLKGQGKIGKIIVILNESSPMQCNFIDNEDTYGIDAALWIGTPGSTGCNAVGKIFSGEINPSGRTSDTFFANSKYNPVYFNFGNQEYTNSSILNSYYQSNAKYYTVYQEGIYNGYKYTETRYEDFVLGQGNPGNFDYNKVVSFPFGYGLSYSDFSYELVNVSKNNDNTYTLTVKVTNTSNISGKEVVQVYVQKPYTELDKNNGIEKPSVELVGYTKVDVAKNSSKTVTINVEEKYFASYDANVDKTYVIGSSNENDKYLLTIAKDSHDAANNFLAYKKTKGATFDNIKIVTKPERGSGNASLVYDTYIPYNKTKYSTNAFIINENSNFTPRYEGDVANFGVDKITNQFDDVDFKKCGYFSNNESNSQTYLTRNNWSDSYGQRIQLTATNKLKEAQVAATQVQDNIPYPDFNKLSFYEDAGTFDEMKLIYLRGKDFNDPNWDALLSKMSFADLCNFLQEGLRFTNQIESIGCPSTSQQNGAVGPNHERSYGELPTQSGFKGFANSLDPSHVGDKPIIFPCNGLIASTYNVDLAEEIGEVTGEVCIWVGYNGIYGLGVNIHRGAYGGRSFEYYSEDGYLTGVAAGYETVGLHKYGAFVLAKHAVINDQESHRAGINTWANEQTIREIYGRAIEIAIAIDKKFTPNPMLGVMTGMNRMGAKWTGSQGFCNTVLKAEYGMRGYAVSDYNSSRRYMDPINGVLNGNDLPDGLTNSWSNHKDYDGNTISFSSYSSGYGKLAWEMRRSAKYILYTIVNSNAMNGIDGNSRLYEVVPLWEKCIAPIERTSKVLFIWASVIFGGFVVFDIAIKVVDNTKKRKTIK